MDFHLGRQINLLNEEDISNNNFTNRKVSSANFIWLEKESLSFNLTLAVSAVRKWLPGKRLRAFISDTGRADQCLNKELSKWKLFDIDQPNDCSHALKLAGNRSKVITNQILIVKTNSRLFFDQDVQLLDKFH